MIAKFCSKCVMPSTKPFITFDKNNVCNACLSHSLKSNAKKGINWSHREQEFEILVEAAKKVKAPYYDFLVPVSGGKDSLTQIHYLLERGLRILAMTVDYGIKTEIGKTNLEIVTHKQGVDLISLRPNMILHKKTIRYGLEMYGDPDLMSHTLIHAYPLRVALNYKIPYVFLGENSAFEYGGNKKLAERKNINSEWFYSYACSNGMTPEKLAKEMGISYEKFKIYDFPFEMDSSDCNCKGVFSSYFHFWDSESNLEIAKKYGFQTSDIPIEGTYR
ncbi:MAG: N-acetyl sugar amidotransferase, partial [Paracoccaceae bacterium]